jgi:hypothetical protein
MKKILQVILPMIMCINIFTGCDMTVISDQNTAISEEVLRCLDEDNAEELKSMFCPKILNEVTDLDDQIKNAMEFYDGKTISHGNILGTSGRSVRGGEIIISDANPYICDIITDANKKYNIKIDSYTIYAEDVSRVGISEILIRTSDGLECKIGDVYLVNPEYK